ncbi:MAG: protein kinase [Clostridiales bacterium]|jgi:serine/threonine protein kinase|nr:protein kinase [Clostridiales bacterium]
MSVDNLFRLAQIYPDYILIAAGGLMACAVIILALRLLATRKGTRRIKEDLTEEAKALTAGNLIDRIAPTLNDSASREKIVKLGYERHGTADITENVTTESSKPAMNCGLDMSALAGGYIIEGELGGGMSKVFLARSVKLGYQCVVKYVDSGRGRLGGEEEILKSLNHINLPNIIDVFHTGSGVYIVQRYIEGITMNAVIDAVRRKGERISAAKAAAWVEELAAVLEYLHSQKPYPIIHCDLKPSNIMITNGDKPVLIDFGISKRGGFDDERSAALTAKYAAPEQFAPGLRNQKIRDDYNMRFGEAAVPKTGIGTHTDIYSLGAIFFELLTGEPPRVGNADKITTQASRELADIVSRCLSVDPAKRYPSARALLGALQEAKNKRSKMARSLINRKIKLVSAAGLSALSSVFLGAGVNMMNTERLAHITVSIDAAILSEQQEAAITVRKILPGGVAQDIDPGLVSWSYSGGNIARIEGRRIVGINAGRAEVFGKYRGSAFSFICDVVKRVFGNVDISLRYSAGNKVTDYAGSGLLDSVDGLLGDASFTSPESITMDSAGVIYVADAGRIRVIADGAVETFNFEPSYITVDKLRSFDDILYALTYAWEEEDGKTYYGIIRFNEGTAEFVHFADAVYTRIEDFAVTEDMLYFIEYNAGGRVKYLNSLNMSSGEYYTYAELSPGAGALCLDGDGVGVFIADYERGVIEGYRFEEAAMSYVAGTEDSRHFIDGAAPNFYEPLRIKYKDGALYVLDYNVLRMIDLSEDGAASVNSVAGAVSELRDPVTETGEASDVIFARSVLMDFIVTDEGILLTDPRNRVIREISKDEGYF